MVSHGDEVRPKKVSHLKKVVRETNEARKEAERDGALSVAYMTGCADCWRISDKHEAGNTVDGHGNYACCHCGSTNLVGQLDE